MLAAKQLESNLTYPKDRHYANSVIETTEKATQALRDVVWINSRTPNSLVDLVNKIHESTLHLSKYYNVVYEAEDLERLSLLKLQGNSKRDAFLLVKECFTNIHKHSHADTIKVKISLNKHQLDIEIHDNGRGFPTDTSSQYAPSTGMGIENIKKYTQKFNGSAFIESQPGEGTKIILSFPLRSIRA